MNKLTVLRNKKGFTLIEIIVVLVILAVMAAFTVPSMMGFVTDARSKAYVAEARAAYVAAQTVSTEINVSGGGIITALADLKAYPATETVAANKALAKMLAPDIDIDDIKDATITGGVVEALLYSKGTGTSASWVIIRPGQAAETGTGTKTSLSTT